MSVAGLLIGLGLIALAAVVGIDAARMRVPPSYARVGPQIFPFVIATGMALTGAWIAWNAWRGVPEPNESDTEGGPTDWKSVGIIAAALIVHLNVLKPLGFVPAGVILFWAVAYAFGSRRYLRDVIVGLCLALFAYLGFRYGLGLQLPPGILKGLI